MKNTHICHTVWMLAVLGQLAHAAGIPTLDVVEVRAGEEGLVGEAAAASEGSILGKQLETRPLMRPAEVLEIVPGVIVTQHAGDGKANQYFLRGFNLDHGTDFFTSVNGIPVNLPTHAHGQGYTDLNFIIPELNRKGALPQRAIQRRGRGFRIGGQRTHRILSQAAGELR